VEIYLTQWKRDEIYRCIKQSYNLEDIRFMGYNAVINIVSLILAVSYLPQYILVKA